MSRRAAGVTPLVVACCMVALTSSQPAVGAGPAAQTLLFERGSDCNVDLYLVRADGSGLRRLTRDGDSYAASWSPDGREIVFTRGNGECSHPDERRTDIWTMRSDGTRLRRLTHDGGSFAASFSRDERLALGTDAGLEVTDRNGARRRVVAKGGGGQFFVPAWSPDGTHLLYSAKDGLHVVDVRSGADRRLDPASAATSDGAWAPDGASIAYSRPCRRGDCRELRLERADGSGRARITVDRPDSEAEDGGAAWSPDGKTLAFVRAYPLGTALVELDAGARSVRTVAVGDADEVSTVAWSTDGTLLAFRRAAGGRTNIWLVHPDGSGLRPATSGRLADDDPVWQP